VDTFDSADLMRSRGPGGDRGDHVLEPFPESLVENTAYYFRVKASDGEAESAWSAGGSFFLNQFNEPPSAPANLVSGGSRR
jgi:hypothetical protein